MRAFLFLLLLLHLLLPLFFGGEEEAPAPMGPPPTLAPDALAEATYPLGVEGRETVTLRGGTFVDEASPLRVELADSLLAWGDLDGDGRPEAVALLVFETGGSGRFRQLVAFGERGGHALPLGAALLGDRVKVHSVVVREGEAVVGMQVHDDDDPMCCPSRVVIRGYRLRGGELVPGRRD